MATRKMRDLCNDALKLIGVVGSGGQASSADADDALQSAIGLLDTMNADRLCVGTSARVSYTWPSGQSSRTIALTGQLVGPTPLWVDWWSVIRVGETVETEPQRTLTDREYAELTDKALTADVFRAVRYVPAVPGLLVVYPVPTTAPTLVLYVPVAMDTEITLNSTLTFRPGYNELVKYSLAKRLAGIFQQPWTRENADILRSASIRVTGQNIVVDKKRNSPELLGRGRFDIDSGQVR